MHTFVYGSRVIENEQQITLERRVRRIGNCVHTVVKFVVAFFLFVGLNALLSNLVHHTNLFSVNAYVNTCRFVQEATRVLFVDSAFSTSSIVYQDLMGVVAALTVVGVTEYGLVVRALGKGDEHKEEEQDDQNRREDKLQTVDGCSVVSYRLKVCFLS